MQDVSNLPQTLSAALSKKGYDELTSVQVAVLDEALKGRDMLVSAQTGSGKTVGFGLAIASDLLDEEGRFDRPAAPLAVVIAPTRELALQVRREFDWLFAEAGIVTASAVGGMDTRTERRALERGVHIVVATPGRLRDHATRGAIDLSGLRAVVLDEADEMLDMGFAEDLEFILDQTPEDRRTLMFSATVPKGILKLAQSYQKDDAERLKVGSPEAQHADIAYSALNVASSDIEKSIINLLCYHDAQTAIIFANTRAMVARLTAKLSNRGFSVVSLSGELSQSERTHAMQALRDKRAHVCVATDVAARGIDLPGLELVIHADLPSNSETLLHRSGRTGRAGRKGQSIMIVPGRHRSKAQRLLRTAKLDAEWGAPPSAEDVLAREEDRIISKVSAGDPPSAEETAFAERLLQEKTPEEVAAAYLRLYRENNSAPEILSPPMEQGKRRAADREAFGPSTWYSLSLGRKHRAEPRWLLPMLCRNAGLSKSAIGAIRVQYQETFVEISDAAVPAMKQELGPELALEQGAKLTELPGAPDFDASPKGPPAEPRGPKADNRRSEKPKGAPRPQKAKEAPKTAAEAAVEAREAATKGPRREKGEGKPKRDAGSKKPRSGGRDGKPKAKVPAKGGPRREDAKPGSRDSARNAKGKGGQKPGQKSKGRKDAAPRAKGAMGKGGEARPFRKPAKRT
ncbi:MAG: DEAD/DEAH box helicase [Pseudomonadota bacterium]